MLYVWLIQNMLTLFIVRQSNVKTWFEAFSQRSYMHSLMISISKTMFKTTLFSILDRFVFFVFCIDSKSLYDCLIKLNTTQKKRFIIDVMSLRQSYERRKIMKMKWIPEINNSIVFMIKIKTFSILKTLININKINMNINEWIKRSINKTDH